MKPNEMNSKEIARLAGVSRSTVSRVVNNYPNVPPKTREKVMRIIEQYKYAPLASARALAGKTNRTIGLFLVDKGCVSGDVLTSMQIVSVIEHASALGYHVLTHIVRDMSDRDQTRRATDMFYQRRIDGGIFIGAANEEPSIEELVKHGFAVGLVDHALADGDEPNRIVANFDNDEGMRLVLDYLAELGHRRIGMILGDPQRLSGMTKERAFRSAMHRLGLEVQESWLLPGDFREQAGYDAVRTFLSSGVPLPTAIVAANDSVAFGAIRALRERGLRVPEDISIVGFDDHLLAERFQPALTTARIDFKALTRRLTDLLIRRIEGDETAPRRFVEGYRLIVRDSCSEVR